MPNDRPRDVDASDFKVDVEIALDAHSLGWVLARLAEIADDKAEHLRANWQDEASARVWAHYAGRLDTLAAAAERDLGPDTPHKALGT